MRRNLVIGEGDKLIGVSASLSGLGRRLGLVSWVSEKLTVKDNRRAYVGSSGFLFRRKGPKVHTPISAMDPCPPMPGLWDVMNAFKASAVVCPNVRVVGILAGCRLPKIGDLIVEAIAIYVVDKPRNIRETNTIRHREDDPMDGNVRPIESYDAVTESRFKPSYRASTLGVSSLTRLRQSMVLRAELPDQLTRNLVTDEAF